MKRFYLIFFLAISVQLQAQNETSNWYFGFGLGLSFNDDTVNVLIDGKLYTNEGSASYSDTQGNLLLYTDGDTIWNKDHQVITTGLAGGCSSTQQAALIVPYPGTNHQYFVFSNDCRENYHRSGLNYTIVDVSINNGTVIEKNINVHKPGTEALSAVGKCGCIREQQYWIAAAKENEPGEIYTYFLDKDGLHPTPVTSSFKFEGWVQYLKFSPDGTQAAFYLRSSGTQNSASVIVADFDFLSGQFSNFRNYSTTNGYATLEFSPNGKILYFRNETILYQMTIDQDKIYPVFQWNDFPFHGNLQLAPNGRIYFPSGEVGVINFPNLSGDAIDINHRAFQIGHLGHGMPGFISSLLYQDLGADAGKDTILCSGQSLRIGPDQLDQGVSYLWEPIENIDNHLLPNPVFNYVNPSDSIQTFPLILTASDNYCSQCDTIKISVLPKQDETIYGPYSVCPGVEGVNYNIRKNIAYDYVWEVAGGEITAGRNSDLVTIDWGPTNSNAFLKVKVIPKYNNCDTLILEKKIRINVELQTDTPRGNTQVCSDLISNNHLYEVTYTNGSTYEWGIENGIILSGQGTNQVIANWQDPGFPGKIWVEEESITPDTVCYGVSDTLFVNFFTDTTSLSIMLVTVLDNEPEKILLLHDNPSDQYSGNFIINRSNGNTWSPVADSEAGFFLDDQVNVHNFSYSYALSALSKCLNPVNSLPHNTLLLQYSTGENSVDLNWNAYSAWDQLDYEFEIWKKTGKDDTLSFVQNVKSSQLSYSFENLRSGLDNLFRVSAYNNELDLRSWSNQLEIDLKYPVFVPNVLTPNGDGKNDYFIIENLELYPENHLSIYNRFGNLVFQMKGYNNSWQGNELPSGIYYYSLRLDNINMNMKGWIHKLL